MGRGMSANLLNKVFQGVEGVFEPNKPKPAFVVYDAYQPAVDTFLNTHVRAYAGRDVIPASSPAGVCRLAGTVFTMLPSSPQVESVYLGENGLLEALRELSEEKRKESLFVDCTTLDQSIAKMVAATMREQGAEMIDAPVSGGKLYFLICLFRENIEVGEYGVILKGILTIILPLLIYRCRRS